MVSQMCYGTRPTAAPAAKRPRLPAKLSQHAARAPASNMVGPAHLIQQHQLRIQAQHAASTTERSAPEAGNQQQHVGRQAAQTTAGKPDPRSCIQQQQQEPAGSLEHQATARRAAVQCNPDQKQCDHALDSTLADVLPEEQRVSSTGADVQSAAAPQLGDAAAQPGSQEARRAENVVRCQAWLKMMQQDLPASAYQCFLAMLNEWR